jgi:hypothetical protein
MFSRRSGSFRRFDDFGEPEHRRRADWSRVLNLVIQISKSYRA